MKNTYLIVLASIILCTSCTKEIVEKNEITHIKISTEAKAANTTYIENSDKAITYRMKNDVDKVPKLFTLYPTFKQKIETNSWQEVHDYLKGEFLKLDDKNAYSFDIQMLSYEILVKKILPSEATEASNKATAYYLNLLVEQNAIDLDILTAALVRLKNSLPTSDYNYLKNHLLKVAKEDLESIPPLLEKTIQQLETKGDTDRNLEKHIIYYNQLIKEANETINAFSDN